VRGRSPRTPLPVVGQQGTGQVSDTCVLVGSSGTCALSPSAICRRHLTGARSIATHTLTCAEKRFLHACGTMSSAGSHTAWYAPCSIWLSMLYKNSHVGSAPPPPFATCKQKETKQKPKRQERRRSPMFQRRWWWPRHGSVTATHGTRGTPPTPAV
jgi:hypothetical protein